jgi:hypothetical protein
MSQISNLFLSIGKPVKDEYGRTIGKIASFALTPNGQFDATFIEFNDGRFSKQPMENLKFDGADITFISTIKSHANVLCDQIPLIWRKDQALRDLADKKKISPEIYQELHTNFDSILTQMKNNAQALTDEIDNEIANCEDETKTLSYAIVNLELEHEIGKIDDGPYKSAFTLLQETLKRVNAQKSDMELTKSKISNIVLGDSPEIEEQKIKTKLPTETKISVETKIPDEPVNEAPPAELPEPPVVVYVKEVGKAGI